MGLNKGLNTEIRTFLNYSSKEGKIYLPNEIFSDLQANIDSPKQIAFAYTYYYTITYMYRYAKYQIKRYTQSDLKEMLGYNKSNKRIDFMIKQGGTLDEIGYTRTSSDYPIDYSLDVDGKPEFRMYQDFKTENFDELKQVGLHNGRNYTVKFPVKAFYRTPESEIDGVRDGTLYEGVDTHSIPISHFISAMENEEIGCVGFYLYGYLKHRIDYYRGRLTLGLDSISKATGLSKPTVVKYRDALEKYGFIVVTHEKYIVSDSSDDHRANTYMSNVE